MLHEKIKLSVLLLFGFCLAGLQAQRIKDIDGNVYITETIGTQTWLAENLKTTTAILLNNTAQISAKEKKPQVPVTIRNEALRFELTTPGSWSFSKIVQQDPYEEMKSGIYSSSLSTGTGDKVPENWNGFKLISTDGSNDPQPFLIIYGHKVGDQKPEEFATLFKRTLSKFSGEAVKADWAFSVGDAKGFDCIYGLGAKVRYTALYKDSIRVVIMYFFPSSDPTFFDKYAPGVDGVIKSIKFK